MEVMSMESLYQYCKDHPEGTVTLEIRRSYRRGATRAKLFPGSAKAILAVLGPAERKGYIRVEGPCADIQAELEPFHRLRRMAAEWEGGLRGSGHTVSS